MESHRTESCSFCHFPVRLPSSRRPSGQFLQSNTGSFTVKLTRRGDTPINRFAALHGLEELVVDLHGAWSIHPTQKETAHVAPNRSCRFRTKLESMVETPGGLRRLASGDARLVEGRSSPPDRVRLGAPRAASRAARRFRARGDDQLRQPVPDLARRGQFRRLPRRRGHRRQHQRAGRRLCRSRGNPAAEPIGRGDVPELLLRPDLGGRRRHRRGRAIDRRGHRLRRALQRAGRLAVLRHQDCGVCRPFLQRLHQPRGPERMVAQRHRQQPSCRQHGGAGDRRRGPQGRERERAGLVERGRSGLREGFRGAGPVHRRELARGRRLSIFRSPITLPSTFSVPRAPAIPTAPRRTCT